MSPVYAGTLVIALVLNLFITKAVLLVANKKGILDLPNNRTVHTSPVPRLGGVGLAITFTLCFLVALGLHFIGVIQGFESLATLPVIQVVGVFLTINFVGLWDDLRPIRAISKFLWQTVTALVVISSGYYLKELQVPFTHWNIDLGPLGPIITYFWIVGISNAINLIDGMDGLAGGISLISIAAFGIYFALVGLPVEALLSFILMGAVLGFLWYNFPPAKTFMGDSGSLFLGAALAILPLMGGDRSPFSVSWIIVPILVLIPIADTLGAIWRRLRDGRPVFAPDKEHMHHKLLFLGFSAKQILTIVYFVELILVSPLIVTGFTLGKVDLLIRFWLPLGSILLLLVFFILLHFSFRAKMAKEKSS